MKFDSARRDGLDLGPDILVDCFEGFQIHPDSTGYDWTEEAPILSSFGSLVLSISPPEIQEQCRLSWLSFVFATRRSTRFIGCHFTVQSCQEVKITEAGQCKCMHSTTFKENSLLTPTDPNRSSLTVFNMFQRFSLRPMRSFVRCFRVAWLLLNNWYKPQVRASGRGRGDALTGVGKPPREVINQTNLLDKWPPPKKYSWQLKCREES